MLPGDPLTASVLRPVPVTVIVFACDDAREIEGCLHSLKSWAAQIVVVDTGSRDETVSIARRFADQVLAHPSVATRDALARLRNESTRFATQDWILFLAACERVLPGLVARLGAFLAKPSPLISAVRLPYARPGGARWWPGKHAPTLLRRWYFQWRPGDGEGVLVNGRIARLAADESGIAIRRRGAWRAALALLNQCAYVQAPAFPAAERARPPALSPLPVTWEGPQFVYSSPGHINRELCLQLSASEQVELEVLPTWADEFDPASDSRLLRILGRIGTRPSRPAAVHVRHDSPSDLLEAPVAGAWVLMQPWDYGGLPDRMVPFLEERIDEIWVFSSWTRECYVRSGVSAEKVVVIPLGVDMDTYRPVGPRYALHTTRQFKFLFLGWLVARKGFDLLLDSYLSAFSTSDDVCLVIKGAMPGVDSGAFAERLQLIAAARGAPALEYIPGNFSDLEIASLYRSCDALVLPYRGESFALPVAEAMASGLPVIVTGYGGCLEYCDEETAFLVPADELPLLPQDTPDLPPSAFGYWWAEPYPAVLAELMRWVAAHPQAAGEVGARGRRRIAERYQWRHTAARILDRLQVLVRRTPRRFCAPCSGAAPMVSVVVATHGPLERVRLCLESVRRYTPEPHELILVDNGSADGTGALLRAIPGATVLANPNDPRIDAGRNLGMAAAIGEYVLLLGDDTVVTEGWLGALLGACRPPAGADIVGPRSNAGRELQRVPAVPYRYDLAQMEAFAQERALRHSGEGAAADEVEAFCLLLRRSVVARLGGIDLRFADGPFAYRDFCLRGRRAGYRLWIADDAFVHRWDDPAGAPDDSPAALHQWARFKAKWQLPPDLPLGEPHSLPISAQSGEDFVPLRPDPPFGGKGRTAFHRFLYHYNRQDYPEALAAASDFPVNPADAGEAVRQDEIQFCMGNALVAVGDYRGARRAYAGSLGAAARRLRRHRGGPQAQSEGLRYVHLRSLLANNCAVAAYALGRFAAADAALRRAQASPVGNPIPALNRRAMAARAAALHLQEFYGYARLMPLCRLPTSLPSLGGA